MISSFQHCQHWKNKYPNDGQLLLLCILRQLPSTEQRVHSVTKFSPYYLLYGKHPLRKVDNQFPVCTQSLKESPEERLMRMYKERLRAFENTCRNQLRDKRSYDKSH